MGAMPDTHDLYLPTKPDDLVYEECRYVEKYSPYCIYIPKKDLMFKLMRSCVNVKNPETDFWINRENKNNYDDE